MNVLIVLDSFKGSLDSLAAGRAAAAGVSRACPEAKVTVRPLADGGEGTVEALVSGLGGTFREAVVTGPLGAPVTARYGLLPEGTAVMEMAQAAGLTLVPPARRNPLLTTTFGVGEMILHALKAGARRFLLGIGGSATNDGGAGMLQALGFALEDDAGRPVPRGGAGLARLRRVTRANVPKELRECVFRIACDVTNPLCGEKGASAVFGPQKGASAGDVARLDAALGNFARTAARAGVPGADRAHPGDGAAGGLGFACRTFLGGVLEKGVSLVLDETHLEDFIRASDIVVTGEGRLDAQTVMGKAPIGVAQCAKKYAKPVVAFAGAVTPEAEIVNAHGIDAFFPILRTVTTLEEALDARQAARNLAATAEQAFRALRLGGSFK